MLLTPLLLALCTAHVDVALAGPPSPKDQDAARAEYLRLSGELRSLAERSAWAGVESTYKALIATGVAPSFDDHLHGAHAARAAGDVTTARERLLLAHAIREEKEAMDWLWEIDSAFGKVALYCTPGSYALEPASMPFQADRSAAVRFAQDRLATTGVYEGFLPAGDYQFGTYEVKVQPRVSTVRIDARGAVAPAPVAVAPAPKARPVKPSRERPAPEPVAVAPAPEPVAVAPAPAPVVDAPAPVTVEAPEPAVAEADPEPALRDPEPVTPRPAPAPTPSRPKAEGGPALAVLIGTGNRFGTVAGAGLAAVVRPVPALGIEVGGGYDVAWTRPGFSAGLRAYPVRIAYLGAAFSPVVWYRGDAVGGARVAYGPQVMGGLDLGLADLGVDGAAGRLKIDVSGGVGYTKLGDPVPADQQQRVGGTLGLGIGFVLGG